MSLASGVVSTGPMPGISPGRSASSSRVASGTITVIRPANPPGAARPGARRTCRGLLARPRRLGHRGRRRPGRRRADPAVRCRPGRRRPGRDASPCRAAGQGKRGPGAGLLRTKECGPDGTDVVAAQRAVRDAQGQAGVALTSSNEEEAGEPFSIGCPLSVVPRPRSRHLRPADRGISVSVVTAAMATQPSELW
jgi:hypothetical protein